jgi:hypothetical protein
MPIDAVVRYLVRRYRVSIERALVIAALHFAEGEQ